MKGARWMAAVFAPAIVSACIDFSPLPYTAPEGGATDASIVNSVGDGAASSALVAACQKCIVSGACATKATACEANAKCSAVTACITTTSCWAMINVENVSDLPPCVGQCMTATGIATLTDPDVLLALPLFTCAQAADGCQSTCAPNAAANADE